MSLAWFVRRLPAQDWPVPDLLDAPHETGFAGGPIVDRRATGAMPVQHTGQSRRAVSPITETAPAVASRGRRPVELISATGSSGSASARWEASGSCTWADPV